MNAMAEFKLKRSALTQYGREQYLEMARLITLQDKVRIIMPGGRAIPLPIAASGIEGSLFYRYQNEQMECLLNNAMTIATHFEETGSRRHLNMIIGVSKQIKDFWQALDCFFDSHHVKNLDIKEQRFLYTKIYTETKPCLDSYLNALNLRVNRRLTLDRSSSIPVLTEVT